MLFITKTLYYFSEGLKDDSIISIKYNDFKCNCNYKLNYETLKATPTKNFFFNALKIILFKCTYSKFLKNWKAIENFCSKLNKDRIAITLDEFIW